MGVTITVVVPMNESGSGGNNDSGGPGDDGVIVMVMMMVVIKDIQSNIYLLRFLSLMVCVMHL